MSLIEESKNEEQKNDIARPAPHRSFKNEIAQLRAENVIEEYQQLKDILPAGVLDGVTDYEKLAGFDDTMKQWEREN